MNINSLYNSIAMLVADMFETSLGRRTVLFKTLSAMSGAENNGELNRAGNN
jgi:hypothetical protein